MVELNSSKQKWISFIQDFKLAAYCGFANRDEEIKQQIIESCAPSRLRRRALELTDEENALTKGLDIAHRMEDADHDTSAIEDVRNEPNPDNDVCHVQGVCNRKTVSKEIPQKPRSNQY